MSTLDEAFAQADEQLNNGEDQTEEVSETEETKPEAEDQAESKEEAFSNIKPDELPEELKGVYKSLQADYTRKTQEAAKIRKESETRISELEKKLEELSKPSQSQEPYTPEDQLRSFVKGELEAEKVTNFRNQAIQDYEGTDPRLKLGSDTYDKPTDLFVGQEMDEKLAEHIKAGKPEYTFDHKSALKEVLSNWDEYVQSKNKDFLEKQSKIAKTKTQQVNRQNPQGLNLSGRPKKVSLDEAIALAQQKS
jgi:hypothetical protein